MIGNEILIEMFTLLQFQCHYRIPTLVIMVSHDQKSHDMPNFDFLSILVLMASCEQKSYAATNFDFVVIINSIVPLTVLSALHDASANFVT